jgi:hypothetical protein
MWKSAVSAVALGWLPVTPAASPNSSHEKHIHQAGSQFGRLMTATMDKMHVEMQRLSRPVILTVIFLR